ncbi:Uma2 family endonuclease [Rhodopirellula sp. JC639]|uniref:Uma2 family endonuclease n=1 Tax=Stieleria mannarensis TaxID=2755585 RepID=UPI0015FF1B86|nr:Uma2 family endonuclease [Rhodopirellula sp. JC639]
MLDESNLESIFASPELPKIAEVLNSKLAAERKARDAFRRELTPSVKAEFIAAEVVMHSPAKVKHLRVTGRLFTLLRFYAHQKVLGEVFSEKTLICLTRNDYEPDLVFFGKDKAATFGPDHMQFPAPDFVVEVLSESTVSRDRGVKFQDYARHGIAEYRIIDCDEKTIEQYVLREGKSGYHLAQKLAGGSIESRVVDGFAIPVAAVFEDEANAAALAQLCD